MALILALLIALAACGPRCPRDFHAACATEGCAAKVARALERDPALASALNADGAPPLNLAADKEIAEALLAAGADIHAVARDETNPLAAAVFADRGQVANLLLDRGAKARYLPGLLGYAAKKGRAQGLAALLDHGASVDSADPETGSTPLLMAVINDRISTAGLLLQRGANPNAFLKSGVWVLSISAQPGVDTSSAPEGTFTALKLAKSDDMKKLLRDHGAKEARPR